jgi:hypothetical protein
VTNAGDEVLEDIYFGLFVDPDVGNRNVPGYWEDDAAGYWRGPVDTEYGPREVNIAYAYDADGDGGSTTSYYGAMILGHLVDPLGMVAPVRAGINSFQIFTGDQPFENGGDPTNDFERYELMSRRQIDRNNIGPLDIRFLCNTGPFTELHPGESLVFHVGVVCGDGFDGMLDNAAYCKRLFDGITFEYNGEEMQAHWMLEQPPVTAGALDIRPGTCSNPFNIRNFEFAGSGNPNRGGRLPVAILGGEGFDVMDIDISTVRLNGVAPLRKGQSFCDIAGPGDSEGPCHCTLEGPDGHTDLLLKFSNQDIAATRLILSIPQPGEKWTLTMTGKLMDGTVFQMHDCVTLVGEPPRFDKPDRPMLTGETKLLGASPNPFNPATTIAFELAAPGDVSITVYDVGGRVVRRLVDGHMPAGLHDVTWNGRDGGGAPMASGVYFYRMIAGDILDTRKMVLLR